MGAGDIEPRTSRRLHADPGDKDFCATRALEVVARDHVVTLAEIHVEDGWSPLLCCRSISNGGSRARIVGITANIGGQIPGAWSENFPCRPPTWIVFPPRGLSFFGKRIIYLAGLAPRSPSRSDLAPACFVVQQSSEPRTVHRRTQRVLGDAIRRGGAPRARFRMPAS